MKTIWIALLGTAVLSGTLAAPVFADPGYTGKSGVEFYGGKPGGFAPGPAFADPGNSGTGFSPGRAPALPAPSNNSAFADPVNRGKSGGDFAGGKPGGGSPGQAVPSAPSPTNTQQADEVNYEVGRNPGLLFTISDQELTDTCRLKGTILLVYAYCSCRSFSRSPRRRSA